LDEGGRQHSWPAWKKSNKISPAPGTPAALATWILFSGQVFTTGACIESACRVVSPVSRSSFCLVSLNYFLSIDYIIHPASSRRLVNSPLPIRVSLKKSLIFIFIYFNLANILIVYIRTWLNAWYVHRHSFFLYSPYFLLYNSFFFPNNFVLKKNLSCFFKQVQMLGSWILIQHFSTFSQSSQECIQH
jgi:hypothetical protein